ncbi:RidA family protein [Thalassobacillus sp. C254]|uniref:RidA family protein n=1 Tax=Thalassobacillus sp. C254 TaxID=1225341 RepID=UPI0006CFFAA3|nr:RidA family protein [Thalassobacillus sp. C254]
MKETDTIENDLKSMGLTLPPLPKRSGNYLPAKQHGKCIYLSGITCKTNGQIEYKGKVGEDVSTEDAYYAARLCTLNHLAVIKSMVGSLEQIKSVIKLVGYVNCRDDYQDVPLVINGASDLLIELFGERGQHARCAVGVSSLPGLAAVETDLIVEVK